VLNTPSEMRLRLVQEKCLVASTVVLFLSKEI